MVETRKDEVRYVTSDPKKMLNKFIVKRVLKTWEESFIDESTGETVNIERNDVLFERGTFIDRDVLARIQFCMQADGVTEVEVSNQNRVAFEVENKHLYPFLSQAEIGDKKHEFLLYATSINNALDILKDYIELNYTKGFCILMVKEFDSCVILEDNLTTRKVDERDLMEAFAEDSEEEKAEEKKFYQLEVNITFEEEVHTQVFVVHTFNVDRAMMLITHYLMKKEEECEVAAISRGHDYNKREIHTAIESAKSIPVGCFIPREFSMAYLD